MAHPEILFVESNGLKRTEILFPRGFGKFDHSGRPVITQIIPIPTDSWLKRSFCSVFKQVFLPEGYPKSVTADYCTYQLWESIQALASTIMGILTTRSVIRSIGVRELIVTPMATSITWVLRDGIGMFGRIAFAWSKGGELDAQCKKWRLFADILNNVAMGIELVVPYFATYSTAAICLTTGMKSVIGIAGSATRAALTQHQALENNFADISAKNNSQETCVKLIASFIGVLILSISPERYIFNIFTALAILHIYANYLAVKAIKLNSLNEDRLSFIIEDFILYRVITSTKRVSSRESSLIFQKPVKTLFGFHIEMGTPLEHILRLNLVQESDIHNVLILFHRRKYFPVMDFNRRTIHVLLSSEVSNLEIIRAYFHCCIFGFAVCLISKLPSESVLKLKQSGPTYAVMRMLMLAKRFIVKPDERNKQIPMSVMAGIDQIVYEECYMFMHLLEESQWRNDTGLLPMKSWKGLLW